MTNRNPNNQTAPTGYDVSELPSLGWILIFEQGEENTYFTLPDGSTGFVKVGH